MEVQFILIRNYPEDAGGLEEGYNRAWLHREVGRYDTMEETMDALAVQNAAVPEGDEWTYHDIVSPQWYLDGLKEMRQQLAGSDEVPF